ncbi:MAG TPA: dTDP-4-dehydrorhamnose 3,5-epimerase family protein [Candidatus Limnocylindria bacterium]|nr:dTDP-4-dehydrorhamnose 3,5-epimerase family protein [Candidatus Limnocylindria bacterium]
MNDGWQPTSLPGVMRRALVRHDDPRGTLRETWRASWLDQLDVQPLAQANHTISRAGALRGLHLHLRQTDLWVMLDGRGHVGLADIRGLLDGRDEPVPTLSLELASGDCLLIPVGVAHGLWALTDVSLLYLVTTEYDATDEHGFAWNDPSAGVIWPAGSPILSDRDRSAPALADAVAKVRQS